jgi:hypothetical protein
MLLQFPSKVQKLIGNQCLEIGVKIGKATLTSTDKVSRLRSLLAMVGLWLLIMLHPLDGPLVRLSPAFSSDWI